MDPSDNTQNDGLNGARVPEAPAPKKRLPNVPTLVGKLEYEELVFQALNLINNHQIIDKIREGTATTITQAWKDALHDFVTEVAKDYNSYNPDGNRSHRNFKDFIIRLLNTLHKNAQDKGIENASALEVMGSQLCEDYQTAELIKQLAADDKKLEELEKADKKLASNLQCESIMGLPTEKNSGILGSATPMVSPCGWSPPGDCHVDKRARLSSFQPPGGQVSPPSSLTTSPPFLGGGEDPYVLKGNDAAKWFGMRYKDNVDELDAHSLLLKSTARTFQRDLAGVLRVAEMTQKAALRDKLVATLRDYTVEINTARDQKTRELFEKLREGIRIDLEKLDSDHEDRNSDMDKKMPAVP